jgi:predicted RNA binding protein YcfA (HicA-like mRNA interferase family)
LIFGALESLRSPSADFLLGRVARALGLCYSGRVKVRELIVLLEADGWFQVRVKGSHRQFHHPSKRGTVTVAGKPSVDVPPGTLNSALKQAGLKKPE